MGTRQLQADRRVAEVTLNEAGKAQSLTLAPGWSFNGSSGPFTLDNVEHGHKIVRGAEPDGSVAVGTRRAKTAARKPRETTEEGIPPEPSADRKPVSKPGPREGPVEFVYRLMLKPKEGSKATSEAAGWLKSTHPFKGKALADRTFESLAGHCFASGARQEAATRDTHESASFRWTNGHEADARKRGELGAPYGGSYGD